MPPVAGACDPGPAISRRGTARETHERVQGVQVRERTGYRWDGLEARITMAVLDTALIFLISLLVGTAGIYVG